MIAPSQPGFDEGALVAQVRGGDSRAFNELVRRYEGKIFRLAQHITQNREDAEDVLQETAEALELSVPAVKSRLLRARLQLRERLTRYFKRKGDDAFAYL